MACDDCMALLPPGSEVHTMGGFACAFCGQAKSTAGPMTPTQAQHIVDGSRGKRIVAGGDGKLREHRLVSPDQRGKPVHVLDLVGGLNIGDGSEPWFTCRVSGETPGAASVYPAYPLSALEPYDPTEDARLYAERQAFFSALDTRLGAGAKEYGERSFSRTLPELLGEIEQEVLDISGWSHVIFVRLRRLREAMAEAERLAQGVMVADGETTP